MNGKRVNRRHHKERKTMVGTALAIVTITASVLVLTSFNFPGRSKHGHSDYSIPQGYELTDLALKDGIYTGTATGFQPGLTVEVTVKDGAVALIEITEHNEVNRQFWQRPVNLIPEEILKRQRTDVDAVSGATATSKGIMAAVENALFPSEDEG